MDFRDRRVWYAVAAVIIVPIILGYGLGWFGGEPMPALRSEGGLGASTEPQYAIRGFPGPPERIYSQARCGMGFRPPPSRTARAS
jgi:hypothetical protein